MITNVVKHTIGKNFLDVKDVNSPSGAAIKVTVEPNPVDQTAQIAFDQPGAEFQTFDLYDVAGKLVQSYNFSGNHLEFKREHLPAGMYLFDIRSRNGTRIGAGKMLLK